MKKLLFLVGIVSLFGTAMGQGLTVTDVEFTSNPLKFNNKIVTIKEVKLNTENSMPGSVVVGGGSVISAGPGGPVSKPVGAPVVRCNAPRGFRAIDIDFLNDPSFNACFFMSEAMYVALPKGQPSLNMQITFRGDNNFGYVVNLYKLK